MMERWTAEDLARVVVASIREALQEARRFLATHPDEALALLEELATSREPTVRAWAGTAAADFLGQRATELLLKLARDRNADVRDSAVDDLLQVDPKAARALAPALRTQLKRRDEPVFAAWALAKLGDTAAVPLLESLEHDDSSAEYVRRIAGIVRQVLERDEDSLIARLRGHDHVATRVLAIGLRTLGTEKSMRAVEAFAADAPDNDCRAACEEVLRGRQVRRVFEN